MFQRRKISHISSALEYLHGLRPSHILHRDLKPANVLGVSVWFEKFKENRIVWKLADFGIAKLLTMDAQGQYYAATHVGTPIYMAPEVGSFTFTFVKKIQLTQTHL